MLCASGWPFAAGRAEVVCPGDAEMVEADGAVGSAGAESVAIVDAAGGSANGGVVAVGGAGAIADAIEVVIVAAAAIVVVATADVVCVVEGLADVLAVQGEMMVVVAAAPVVVVAAAGAAAARCVALYWAGHWDPAARAQPWDKWTRSDVRN